MVSLQKRVPHANTVCVPAICAPNTLAWTDHKDGKIQLCTYSYSSTTAEPIFGIVRDPGFEPAPNTSPAVAFFNLVCYVAWMQNPADAGFIPPSVERHQPPVIVSGCFNGIEWVNVEPLWDPALSGADVWVEGYQGPAATSAPALTATETGLLCAWIELATDGSDALALWYEGQSVSPPPQQQIFYAIHKGATWSPRKPVPHARSSNTPALTFHNKTVYMAFVGESTDHVYYTEYTDHSGWAKPAAIPGVHSSTGPALTADGDGKLHMAWVDSTTGNMMRRDRNAGVLWDPANPENGWHDPITMPVIKTGMSPALAAPQNSGSSAVLAYKGKTQPDIYVVPLNSFDVIPRPSPNLGSSTNYEMNDGGKPLLGVKVILEITEDVVLAYDGPPQAGLPSVTGFAFQLNARSEDGYDVYMQQYIFQIFGNELQSNINNWNAANKELINQTVGICSPPNANVLPAGTRLLLELVQAHDGTVSGGIFNAMNAHGHSLGTCVNSIHLPAGQTSPVTAIQLDLVGPEDGEAAKLISGAGTITYISNNTLVPDPSFQDPATGNFWIVVEQANSRYQGLPGYPTNTIEQRFAVDVGQPIHFR